MFILWNRKNRNQYYMYITTYFNSGNFIIPATATSDSPIVPVDQRLISNDVIMFDIFLRCDYEDINNYLRTHKNPSIPYKEIFWIRKSFIDFKISDSEFLDTNLSHRLRYLELLTNNGGVGIGSERFLSIRECAKRAIENNDSRPRTAGYFLCLLFK